MPQLVKTGHLISFGFFTNRCHGRDVRVTEKVKRRAVRAVESARFRTDARGRP